MATAVVKAEQAEVDNLRINQMLAARLRNRWIMVGSLTDRFSQHCRVVAEK